MRRENFDQLNDGFMLALRKDARAEERFLHLDLVVLNTPTARQLHHLSELRLSRLLFEDLTSVQKAHNLFAEADRNSCVAHSDLARFRAGRLTGFVGQR